MTDPIALAVVAVQDIHEHQYLTDKARASRDKAWREARAAGLGTKQIADAMVQGLLAVGWERDAIRGAGVSHATVKARTGAPE